MAPEPEPPVGCPSYYRPSWAVPNGCPPVVTRTVPAVPVSVVAAAWLCVVLSDPPGASYPPHRLPLLAVGVDTRAVAGAGTVAVASAVVGVEDPPEQARSPQRLHDSIAAAAAAAAKVGQEPHRSHLVECEVMTVVPDFLDIPVALAVVAAAAGCIAAAAVVVVVVVVVADAVMAPAFSDIPAVARPVAAVAVVVAAAVVAAAVVSSIVSNSRILALNHSQRLQRQ